MLFRHLPVAAAFSGLDVANSDVQLASGQRRSQIRVGIAANERNFRSLLYQNALASFQHLCRLLAVKLIVLHVIDLVVRFFKLKVFKELSGHMFRVLLMGVV